jgi:GrpB-like predicted nucleotidyltransferase (UPF0157 family)
MTTPVNPPVGRDFVRREPIELVEYDPAWPAIFVRERAAIVAVLGDDAPDVQHIGSTSVPGLAAKPIVDMAIGGRPLRPPEHYVPRMEALGFTLGRSGEDHQRQIYWKKAPCPVNCHIVLRDSQAHLRHVLLRDYLLAHPEAVAAYAALKRRNAELHAHDIDAYVEAKTELIEALIAREAAARGITYPPAPSEE